MNLFGEVALRTARLRPALRPLRILYAAVLLLSFVLTLYYDRPAGHHPVQYGYMKTTASNGVVLHAVRTSPRNIALRAIDRNVTATGDYGINGGFFWNGDLLSIAVIDNKPIKGRAGDYGTGWYNVDRSKGTLVWDDAAERFSVQVAADPDGLKVTDKQRFWAQGGISMGLSDDLGWYAEAMKEGLPAMDEQRLRTAAVYDAAQNLWLIVTPTPCTGEQFRTAIKERLGGAGLLDGVFLDGDGSSQLKVRQAELRGDGREVYQMIALVK